MNNQENIKNIVIVKFLIFQAIAFLMIKIFLYYYYDVDKGSSWGTIFSTSVDYPIKIDESESYLTHTGYNIGSRMWEKNILYGDSFDNINNYIHVKNKIYPDTLKIRYFSINENKYYCGKFNLDYDKIKAEAKKLVKKDIGAQNEFTNNIYFNSKVNSNGRIILYLQNDTRRPSNKIVIGEYQAKQDKTADWDIFNDEGGRDQSNISSTDIQRALLLNSYNWQIELVTLKGDAIQNIEVRFYGKRGCPINHKGNSEYQTYGNFSYLPNEIIVSWSTKDVISYYARISFDEIQLIEAFNSTNNKDSNIPTTMRLKLKNDKVPIIIELQGNNKSIKLKNTNRLEIGKELI